MIEIKKISKLNEYLYFVGWTIIMLLGADKPPPVGFIIIVMIIAVQAKILNLYSSFYLSKLLKKEKKAFLKNFIYWSLFGLGTGIILSFFKSSESGLPEDEDFKNKIILIIVIYVIGVLNGFVYYLFNKILINKKLK